MRLQLGIDSLERERGDQPRLPVVNMFAEKSRTAEGGVILQSRPSIEHSVFGTPITFGSGPVEQVFQGGDAVFSDDLLAVSGGQIYSLFQNQAAVGTIPGSGFVSMAGNEAGVMIAAGSGLRFWNNATVAPVTFPDGANVIKVITAASRFVAIRADGGKFYWSPPLGTTFNALDFATAENSPDGLRDAVFVDDTLILGGRRTIEFWPSTGDSNQPFQAMTGRVFARGVKQTGCLVEFDSSFAWVGDDNVVYTNGPKPVPLSDPGIEEKIAATTKCRLFVFRIEGAEFLALRVDAGTWALNSRSGLWSEMQSYGEDNWIPQCGTGNDNNFLGSSVDGRIFQLGDDYLDLGGPMERRFRAGAQISGGGQIVNNMTLECNPGQTPYLSGQFADPMIEMRLSRDGGQTWGNWRSASLGEQGQYRKLVQWRALGMASAPGLFAEFRCVAPVPLRVSGVTVNEKWGRR